MRSTVRDGFSNGRPRKRTHALQEGTPLAGYTFDNDATFLDIVPNSRIVIASKMSVGGKPISVALATLSCSRPATGAVLIFTHQAAFFDGAGGPAMCEAGRRRLLERLAHELPRLVTKPA